MSSSDEFAIWLQTEITQSIYGLMQANPENISTKQSEIRLLESVLKKYTELKKSEDPFKF